MRRLLSLLLLLIVACGGQPTTTTPSEDHASEEEALRRMKHPVEDLSQITTQEQYDDYIKRYWDDFDFSIGEDVDLYDESDLYAAFANYVMVIPPKSADSLLRSLMHRASSSREVLDLFAQISRDILYDPNAPTRNDEYYQSVLEAMLESELLDEYDRIAPESDLHYVRQNRRGEPANDFTFSLPDGSQRRLHTINAEYTILMFNNPGCEMCRTIIDHIEQSEVINNLRKSHDIKIIAIYPDEDIEAWREYLSSMPKWWICGHDAEQRITAERTYDLKAIPSLYLLDSDKRVLIRDGVDVSLFEAALTNLTTK